MDEKFMSQIGKIMIVVVAVVVALWIAYAIVLPLVKVAIPLVILGFVVWFVYKVMVSEKPKVG